MEVRRLGPDEPALLRAVRLAALRADPSAFGSTLAREERFGADEWTRRLGPPGVTFVAGGADEEPQGMVWGVPDPRDGRTVELLGLWVAPEARGTGVGDALVGRLITWAEERGAGQIRLCVWEGNDRAEALYRRHGFRRTGSCGPCARDGLVELGMIRSRGAAGA